MRERMGSGGPRGLQILLPGASGVRGGFDSHAFPPILLATLVAVLLIVAGAGSADAAPARRDSTQRHEAWHEQPRAVMLRSLLVPGWGQLHNRAYFKAVAVAAGEGVLIARLSQDGKDLSTWRARVDQAARDEDAEGYAAAATEYNAALDRLVGHQWLLGGVIAYALVDAYVDAHFRDFDIEFRTDPALPDGIPPSDARPVRGGGTRGVGVRAALRWHF